MKTCSKCKAEKAREDFSTDRSRKDGLFPQCKECHAAGKAASYQKHRERVLAQHAEYRRRNLEKKRESDAAYYERMRSDPDFMQKRREYGARYWRADIDVNRAKSRESYRSFADANPEAARVRNWVGQYKARAKAAGFQPVVEDFSPSDVTSRYGDGCFYCEDGAFEHLDHYVSISSGGHHTLENVRPSCGYCNRSKRDVAGDEWLAERSAS